MNPLKAAAGGETVLSFFFSLGWPFVCGGGCCSCCCRGGEKTALEPGCRGIQAYQVRESNNQGDFRLGAARRPCGFPQSWGLCFLVYSVPDPRNFLYGSGSLDPYTGLRILLFFVSSFQDATKNKFFSKFFAYYFLYVGILHLFSKISRH